MDLSNLNIPSWAKYVGLLLLVVLAVASQFVGPFKGSSSNPVEIVAEDAIKEETGLSVNLDLYPSTAGTSNGN
jgi:hypothetical protein